LALKVSDVNLHYTSMGSLNEVVFRDALDYRRDTHREVRRGTIEEHGAMSGSVSTAVYRSSTYSIPLELLREWSEVVTVSAKLVRGERLNELDRLWIEEVAEASGWSVDDVIEELKSLDVDPPERVERYRSLSESYYREAFIHREKGDTRQAGEKMWGAVTALVKLYAAAKGIFISHWGLGKLYSFIENNVEAEYRDLFADLLNEAFVLHAHFYEAHLGSTAFERQWGKVVELVEKAKEIVFKRLAKMST